MKKLVCVLMVIVVLALAGCAASPADVKIGQALYAAHGTKAFAVATVAMQGDKIVSAHMDEYQYLAKDGAIAVPNSDADFGTMVADETRVLASKRVNNDSYSANMAAHGGATQSLLASFEAIEKHVVGKTVADLEKEISGKTPEQMLDAVAGTTLVDTLGYIQAFVEAAKTVK